VIVDGRFLKRDGKLTTIDMAQLARYRGYDRTRAQGG
jgi:hypothetical protein